MDSIQRRERRAKLKQRLQSELEKDLRVSELANELLEEAGEDSPIDNYQVTVKLGQNSVEEIEQMKIDVSYDVIESEYVADNSIRVTQFPVLEVMFEEDDCIIEEEDDEEIMLEKDQSYFSALHAQRYSVPLHISITFQFSEISTMSNGKVNLFSTPLSIGRKTFLNSSWFFFIICNTSEFWIGVVI